MALELYWKKCGDDGHWCNLANLSLSKLKDVGVYIIWHTGDPGRVVRVGQGNISERLAEHRTNPKITNYGELLVTWAIVDAQNRNGVEKYLADTWSPPVGEAFPDVSPIAVNSPFAG